jgi:hypothetical protein
MVTAKDHQMLETSTFLTFVTISPHGGVASEPFTVVEESFRAVIFQSCAMLYEMCHTVEEQSSLSLSPFSTAAARLLAALNYSSVTPSCELLTFGSAV